MFKRFLTSTVLVVCATAATPVRSADWRLSWSDEFDTPGLPDKAKWDYETGFVRNNELQLYTRDRRENARVENGHLVIEGRKERFANPRYQPGGDPKKKRRTAVEFADYTAASLITQGKASFLYGRVEVRAKLPQGQGVWPAIWMLGTSHQTIGWPRCGEIDIMEFVGKDPDRVHATVHFSKDGKHASQGGKLTTPAPYGDFHVYAVEWFPDRMDFFFDEQKYFTFQLDAAGVGADNPFRQPCYLLINLALGGAWGGPMDDAVLPQQYLIDYVRVYEAKKAGAAAFERPAKGNGSVRLITDSIKQEARSYKTTPQGELKLHLFFPPGWTAATAIQADKFLASLGYLQGAPTLKPADSQAVLMQVK